MVIEMPGVLARDGGGVPLVVDQQPIGALRPNAAYEPLGVEVGGIWWERTARTGLDRYVSVAGPRLRTEQ